MSELEQAALEGAAPEVVSEETTSEATENTEGQVEGQPDQTEENRKRSNAANVAKLRFGILSKKRKRRLLALPNLKSGSTASRRLAKVKPHQKRMTSQTLSNLRRLGRCGNNVRRTPNRTRRKSHLRRVNIGKRHRSLRRRYALSGLPNLPIRSQRNAHNMPT